MDKDKMDTDGFVARQDMCKVVDKMDFTDSKNGEQVYILKIAGFGWTKSFRADNREQFESWPEKGTLVSVECSFEPAKDGLYKLVQPVFETIKQPKKTREAATAGTP